MKEKPIGYGSPPKTTQFRPGQSGNPGGRPKKLPTFRAVLERVLAERTRGGDERTVTKQYAIVQALVGAGLQGDARAMNTIIALSKDAAADSDQTDTREDEALLEQYIEKEVERRARKEHQE